MKDNKTSFQSFVHQIVYKYYIFITIKQPKTFTAKIRLIDGY